MENIGRARVTSPSLAMEAFSLKMFIGLVLLAAAVQYYIGYNERKKGKTVSNTVRITRSIILALLFFGLWEGSLRIADSFFPPANPIQYSHEKWLLDPHLKNFPVEGNNHITPVTTNSDGLREKDEILPKKPGEIRFLCFGDSHTAGFGIRQDKTFAKVLESMLREKYPDKNIKVINAGMFGFSVFQAWNLYQKIINRYQPDIVLFCGFNFIANREIPSYYRLEMEKEKKVKSLMEKLFLYRTLRKTLSRFSRDNRVFEVEKISKEDSKKYYKYFAEKLYEDCEKRNIKGIVFDHLDIGICENVYENIEKGTFPLNPVYTPGNHLYIELKTDPSYYKDPAFYPMEQKYQLANPMKKFKDFRYYLLCPEEKLCHDKNLHLKNDPHVAEIGHYAIAEILFKIVEDGNYIK